MTQLEKEIEKKLRKMVVSHGGRCEKVVCLSFAGFPDRTILLPGGQVIFVETKRPKGGVYSALQDKWRDWLLDMGFDYYRIKDMEQLAAFELILMNFLERR